MEIFDILSDLLGTMWQAISYTWFIILPVAFYYIFKFLWMDFVQGNFAKGFDPILLEIVPPSDVEMSPKPMESIFDGLSGTMAGFSAFEEFTKGNFFASFSLEIVGDGGSVHFYIRTPKAFRSFLEALIYAQYPDAEIKKVRDYVDDVPKVIPNRDWELWGSDMELVRPDPYPIKSYRWFEESVTGKMIDPLSSIIEGFGRLGPGQKSWLQIVITPEKESWYNTGQELVAKLAGREEKKEGALSRIFSDIGEVFSNIFSGMFGPVEFSAGDANGGEDAPLEFRLTPGEKEVLKAVEEMVGKSVFKTKMRFVYLGKREGFDRTNLSSFFGSLKQFSDQNLNGFKPEDISKTYSMYFMSDSRLLYRQRKIFDRYKKRNNDGARFILNTEELATIFHMPDMSVVAPSLRKVESKRGGAPVNLPVE